MSTIKHLDLVQSDPDEVNRIQKDKVAKFIEKEGKAAYDKIRWGKTHHELKSERSTDFRLSPPNLQKLTDSRILISEGTGMSFGREYLDLYNNDMPVFITSDSMLHAFHKFYDSWLKGIEEQRLMDEFTGICHSFLNSLYQQVDKPAENPEFWEIIKFLELYFIFPIAVYDLLPVKDRYDELFGNHQKETKPLSIQPKFITVAEIESMVKRIAAFKEDIAIQVNDTEFVMNGSSFKPRGHYNDSKQLQRYFVAFTWLSKLNLPLRDDANNEKPCLTTNAAITAMIVKISQPFLKDLVKLEDFLAKLIGTPDNYVVSSILQSGAIDTSKTLSEFYEMRHELKASFDMKLTERSKMGKFGDIVGGGALDRRATVSFSLIGKCNTIDNLVLSELVDAKNAFRKYASVLDLAYVLYRNDSVYTVLQERMKTVEVVNRDGIEHSEKLQEIRAKYADFEVDSLYTQQLATLCALSDTTAAAHIEPFGRTQWLSKQAMAQAGHYAEMRHDNVLYVDEYEGCMTLCQYADLLIEPVPLFWAELKKCVDILIDLQYQEEKEQPAAGAAGKGSKKSSDNYMTESIQRILTHFKVMISKFQTFLNDYLTGKAPDPELVKELSCVIEAEYGGSGGPHYHGWYPQLFTYKADCVDMKAEVSSLMTGVPDQRDDGAIVHLGTVGARLLYIVVKDPVTGEDKVFLGPVYNVYEFLTPYTTRLTDEDFKNEHGDYEAMNLLIN